MKLPRKVKSEKQKVKEKIRETSGVKREKLLIIYLKFEI